MSFVSRHTAAHAHRGRGVGWGGADATGSGEEGSNGRGPEAVLLVLLHEALQLLELHQQLRVGRLQHLDPPLVLQVFAAQLLHLPLEGVHVVLLLAPRLLGRYLPRDTKESETLCTAP